MRLIRDGENGGGGIEVGGEGDYIPIATLSPPEWLRWETFQYFIIVRDKITRQCPQTTTFEEKGEPKQPKLWSLLLKVKKLIFVVVVGVFFYFFLFYFFMVSSRVFGLIIIRVVWLSKAICCIAMSNKTPMWNLHQCLHFSFSLTACSEEHR